VASYMRESINGNITVQFISVRTGMDVLDSLCRAVRIEPNGTTEVFENKTVHVPSAQDPDKPFDVSKADPFLIYTTLTTHDKQVASDVSWPEPIKYLDFPDRGVQVEYSEDKHKVFVSAEKPVKSFVFAEKEGMKLSDNGFDLVPGKKTEVHVQGVAADALQWRYVGIP
jgi:beta-mannosidase